MQIKICSTKAFTVQFDVSCSFLMQAWHEQKYLDYDSINALALHFKLDYIEVTEAIVRVPYLFIDSHLNIPYGPSMYIYRIIPKLQIDQLVFDSLYSYIILEQCNDYKN